MLLDEALGQGRRLTVALLDVDGFSGINNAVGHQLGNNLLRALGERLARALGVDVCVARLSGDQFGVFGAPAQIQPDALVAIFAVTFTQEQVALLMTASVGLVAQTDLGHSAVETLRRADIALHQAKLQQLRQVVQQGGLRLYLPVAGGAGR
ncbi:MAG: GGDEF domain-containing protein [Pseudomonas sp.]